MLDANDVVIPKQQQCASLVEKTHSSICDQCWSEDEMLPVGKVSFELWLLFTWSFGWTGFLLPITPPRISIARLETTSFTFMFDCVPEPVCQTLNGKWSFSLPAMTSSQAWAIAWETFLSRPNCWLTVAQAFLQQAERFDQWQWHSIWSTKKVRGETNSSRRARFYPSECRCWNDTSNEQFGLRSNCSLKLWSDRTYRFPFGFRRWAQAPGDDETFEWTINTKIVERQKKNSERNEPSVGWNSCSSRPRTFEDVLSALNECRRVEHDLNELPSKEELDNYQKIRHVDCWDLIAEKKKN